MKGPLLVFFGACSYGVLSTLVALAYRAGFTLNDVIGSQMIVGALLLWAIVIATVPNLNSTFKALPLKTILTLMAAGITTGTTGLFNYAALQYLSPALAAVIFFQFTWMGLLIDTCVTRKAPTRFQLFALLPLMIGAILATNLLVSGFAFAWQGLAFGLLSALSNAIRIFVSGRLKASLHPMLRAALMVTGGMIATSLFVPPTFLLDMPHFSRLLFSYGLPLAFFGSVFGVWMFTKGGPLISTGLATILGSMQLPVTIVLSVFVLNIPLSHLQLAGVLLLLAGVCVSEIKPSFKPKLA